MYEYGTAGASATGTTDFLQGLMNNLKIADNYTLSINPISGSWTSNSMGISFRQNASQLDFVQVSSSSSTLSGTKSLASGTVANANQLYMYVTAGATFSNFVFNIQLEQGTAKTAYEPFTAGGATATGIGTVNSYLYRGYRLDRETGLYYLQSRYYDSNWGRFLNADTTDILQASGGDLLGTNLYAYCSNNPVNMVDSNGAFGTPIQWACAAIGGVAGWFFGDYVAKKLGYSSGWKYWTIRAGVTVGGAVIGWFVGTAILKIMSQFLIQNPQYLMKLPSAVLWLAGINKYGSSLSATMNSISAQTMSHIMVDKHLWNLVNAKNATSVKSIIEYTLKNGTLSKYGSAYQFVAPYGGRLIQVTGQFINGIFKISNAWVIK